MHLQSSSKFLELLKSAGERVLTSRDTCHTRRVVGTAPGDVLAENMAHSEVFWHVLPVWALGARGLPGGVPAGSPSVGSRGTWRTRRCSGRISQCGLSGHRA